MITTDIPCAPIMPLGRMRLDTVQIDSHNVSHAPAAIQQLQEILESEAREFGVRLDSQNLDRLIRAVKKGKLNVILMAASGELSQRHFIAAAILFPSVVTIWNNGKFDYYAAQYLEDICISSGHLMKFIRSSGTRLPRGTKLGAHLVGEIIRISSSPDCIRREGQLISRSLIAEYSPKDNRVSAILDIFNATTGSTDDSGVLEISGVPTSGDIPLRVYSLKYMSNDGIFHEYEDVFLVEWSEEEHKSHLVATFTSGISSFTGSPVVRIQIVSNGYCPPEETTEIILRSMISQGCSEIHRRGWHSQLTDDRSMVPLRIHILNEPRIRSALLRVGAVPRMLGANLMMPLSIDYQSIPGLLLGELVSPTLLRQCCVEMIEP